MSRIISVVNQKGGVGKTTTAINLGAALAARGKYVLLIDIDPQANATSGLGIDHREVDRGMYEALVTPVSIREIVQDTRHDGYRIAPSSASLAGATVELVNMPRREFLLADKIREVVQDYDYVIIDSPPSLDLLTINGIVASDEILIPVQCEYLSLEGLSQLLSTINLVKKSLNQELTILGAVMTMYDPRYKLTHAVMEELYKYFPQKIFRSVIPRNIKLAEAPSHGIPIQEYSRRSKAAKAYDRLSREVIDTEIKPINSTKL
ncbi:AAA family ATPase [Patescibacteria group bacterium]|nr:AAA family ATPase [Patescibacteria group bacterium]MBU1891099.1 AAA family ATPase [Patescibacteria group bacterium]